MSYDITVEGDVPDDVEYLDWNYTYNVQPMTAAAGLPSLTMLDGVPAPVAVLALQVVLDRFDLDPDRFKALNPKNGWGDFDGFRQRLGELRAHLLLTPKATVRVG